MQWNVSAGGRERVAALPILLVLFGGVFLGALDIAIVGPALPAIQAELGLDARQVSAVFSVYILVSLAAAPLLASLSDRIGRRPVYLGCLLLFGAGSVIVATSGSIEILLAGRAVQAIGAGGTLPVATAVVADTFPVERRGRALGLIGAVFGLAFVLGPVVGAVFLQWSWRWLFLVNLPLVALLIGASAVLLDDGPRKLRVDFDLTGALLLALGLASLAYGAARLEYGADRFLGIGGSSVAAFAITAAMLYLFWRAEQRAAAPIVEPRLLGSMQMRIIGLLGLATGLVEASMVFLPTLAVGALDVAPSRASFMLLPLVMALIAGSIVAGRLLDRFGAKPVIQVGMALTILGLLLFSSLPLTAGSFYAAGITVGLGLASLLGAPLRFVALEEGGTTGRGASQGLLTVCLGVGRLFGASMMGGLAAGAQAAIIGYRLSMLVIAIAAGVALIASYRLRRR
ncbi:MAG TPA: MFS transporter [Gammaproteobacteria bacterium]|nr:MFS transporter [Gammaproteobacteria bacterium]